MKIQEAKEILSASPELDRADPLVEEALELASRHPELREWMEMQEAMDSRISAALEEVPVPGGLEQDLLNAIRAPKRKTTPFRATFVWGTGIAAVLCLGLGSFFLAGGEALVREVQSKITGKDYRQIQDFREGMSYFIAEAFFMLDHHSKDLDSIRGWLEDREVPGISELPESLAALDPIGCKELTWQGRAVSLVCFHKKDGKIVHMFILENEGLDEALYSNIATVALSNGLETGGWLSGNKVYLLVGSEAGVDIEFALI